MPTVYTANSKSAAITKAILGACKPCCGSGSSGSGGGGEGCGPCIPCNDVSTFPDTLYATFDISCLTSSPASVTLTLLPPDIVPLSVNCDATDLEEGTSNLIGYWEGTITSVGDEGSYNVTGCGTNPNIIVSGNEGYDYTIGLNLINIVNNGCWKTNINIGIEASERNSGVQKSVLITKTTGFSAVSEIPGCDTYSADLVQSCDPLVIYAEGVIECSDASDDCSSGITSGTLCDGATWTLDISE